MANSLNNQGVRTPPKGGLGRSVHTFRRELFVKFRKSPHQTEKALRHAQKPTNPRSTNPIGPESTYVEPGKDPPMATPPQGPKNDAGEALSGPSRPLLRLAKVTQKRGFSRRFSNSFLGKFRRRFSGGFLAVFRRFSDSFASGLPAVFQRSPSSSTPVFQRFPAGFLGKFDAGFPAVFQRFCRQFSGSFPAVCRWFDRGFLVVSGRFCRRFYRRFAGDAVPLDQPRSGSGVPLHPKETVGQFRTHFQAYKPSIWEEESFRRYMESREEALPAGTQRPWWKFWGTG